MYVTASSSNVKFAGKFSHISKHAHQRLSERVKFSTKELSFWLDNGIYHDLGSKPGIHKKHLLVYSAEDQNYFVVIQDQYDGEVITILPLEYHKNLAWEVSEVDKAKARNKAALMEAKTSSSQIVGKTIVINAYYLNEDGNVRTKAIYKTPTKKATLNINEIMKSHELCAELRSKIDQMVMSELLGFVFRFGRDGDPIFVTAGEVKFS